MTRTEKALDELGALIEKGAEFPDVIGRVARKHRLKVETLTKAYDLMNDPYAGVY